MPGRLYIQETDWQGVTAVQDLLELPVPSTCSLLIHGIFVDQVSDYTAADAEKLKVHLKKGIGATSGSGGTGSLTPEKYGGTWLPTCPITTAERNNTTQATAGGGSLTVLKRFAWDVLSGLEYVPIPELRVLYAPSELVVLSLETAPADSLTVNAAILFELL